MAIHLCAALRMRVTFDLVNTSLLKMYRADLLSIIKLIIAENLVSFDFVESNDHNRDRSRIL